MTYEESYTQSLKNINNLKNLVVPLETHEVFFDFSSKTEFKIIFFNRFEPTDIMSDLILSKFRAELPIGLIQINDLDHEIFAYEDSLTRYKYNYTTQELIISDQKKGFKNQSSAELIVEMNKLLLRLKNM